jgi:acid stress-induced BolA-like protein IbaG/YrbA
MTSNTDTVKNIILTHLPQAHIQVEDMTGTDDHLEILVVDEIFKGKLLIDQHQIIMDILKESLKESVHAVKIKTLTPEKFHLNK